MEGSSPAAKEADRPAKDKYVAPDPLLVALMISTVVIYIGPDPPLVA